ncbi:magnesium transporter NIPA-domain-containing protein, partial [Mycena leptocephala]
HFELGTPRAQAPPVSPSLPTRSGPWWTTNKSASQWRWWDPSPSGRAASSPKWFAPPIMVTPLGALSVIVAAVFASFLLNERLGHLGHRIKSWKPSRSFSNTPSSQVRPTVAPSLLPQVIDASPFLGFLFYCFTVLIFSLIMAYGVASRYGCINPLVYILNASLVGGVSVMFVKGFSVALKLTFSGENQFVYPSMYLFALGLFGVNLVNPIYYVGFCTATIVASLILFKGSTPTSSTVSLLSGFLGVHILNLAMVDESEVASRAASNVSLGGGGNSSGSAADAALWGVCDRGGAGEETVRLERLEEEEEEYGRMWMRRRHCTWADNLYYAYSIQREVPVVDLT